MNKFWLNFYSTYLKTIGDEFPIFAQKIQNHIEKAFYEKPHGKLNDWQQTLETTQGVDATEVNIDADTLSVKFKNKVDIERGVAAFKPWRKGPFQIGTVFIDTEWRSDWKWQRIKDKIISLKGKRVLDVGCGSGYHCFRMKAEGAAEVIGLEPMISYVAQFIWLNQWFKQTQVNVLPYTLEAWTAEAQQSENYLFDTVFSMGVLYHRRSPIDHLYELKQCLNPGGQLVLETMIIEGDDNSVLMPEGRYAKMRNVWFIPTVAHLINWLHRAGFKDIKVIDINQTSIKEQRTTKWMEFESLVDFLDKDDVSKTIEGYPAPLRATITAIKK
jgi:tRNA (mo5U34)-methyltransferase